MGGVGGFPVDLILFGMVAAFLVLRLRSILGRRTGFERSPQPAPTPTPTADTRRPVIEGKAERLPVRPVPDPNSETGRVLARMQTQDRNFSAAGFLDGAERAFRLIVAAYAQGDRKQLRPLLGDDVYTAFEHAIATREAAGETQKTEIRALPTVEIETATLVGALADITVRFVSDQVNMVADASGNPIIGTDAMTEIVDLWTFERDLSQRDPTWRLSAARSA